MEIPIPPRGARGKIFKQTTIASYKLLPDDSIALMDAMEYEQDVWAAEAAAYDRELLELHPLVNAAGLAHLAPRSGRPPKPGVWVMNSGAARLRASAGEYVPPSVARGKGGRGGKGPCVVFPEVFRAG